MEVRCGGGTGVRMRGLRDVGWGVAAGRGKRGKMVHQYRRSMMRWCGGAVCEGLMMRMRMVSVVGSRRAWMVEGNLSEQVVVGRCRKERRREGRGVSPIHCAGRRRGRLVRNGKGSGLPLMLLLLLELRFKVLNVLQKSAVSCRRGVERRVNMRATLSRHTLSVRTKGTAQCNHAVKHHPHHCRVLLQPVSVLPFVLREPLRQSDVRRSKLKIFEVACEGGPLQWNADPQRAEKVSAKRFCVMRA